MNAEEFNIKYEKYLEDGHYGLDVHNEEFIEWLDKKFEEFIKYPGFKFTQIKEKFRMGRFYCDGIPRQFILEVEGKIDQLYKK